jgi:hypothetical protein
MLRWRPRARGDGVRTEASARLLTSGLASPRNAAPLRTSGPSSWERERAIRHIHFADLADFLDGKVVGGTLKCVFEGHARMERTTIIGLMDMMAIGGVTVVPTSIPTASRVHGTPRSHVHRLGHSVAKPRGPRVGLIALVPLDMTP